MFYNVIGTGILLAAVSVITYLPLAWYTNHISTEF